MGEVPAPAPAAPAPAAPAADAADAVPLLVAGGRVVDPATGVDAVADVLLEAGRVAAVGAGFYVPTGTRVLDATDRLVVPGLIDLHCHVYWGGTMIGVEPDPLCLPAGVTTAVDLGSAGADNFAGLRRFVIEPATTRVISFLHVASIGLVNQGVGELRDNAYASVEKVVETVAANRDLIAGLKVRLGNWITGPNTAAALEVACAARDAAGVPLAVHVGNQPLPLPDVLAALRPGDIVTHVLRAPDTINGIFDDRARLLPEVWAAQERGVVFDVGHGSGSFAFEGARLAIAEGFRPNTISTDAYAHNVRGPVFDLPTTMSKLLALGMTLEEIIPRVTAAPATVLAACPAAAGIGSLRPGAVADLAVLELVEGRFAFRDSRGGTLEAPRRFRARATVRAGRLVYFPPRAAPAAPAADAPPGAP
jgi:dihydroorotase